MTKTLGDLVRRYRESLGLSLNGLAKRAGLDPASLWRLETGAGSAVQWGTVCALADALGIPTDDLRPGKKSKNPAK